MKPAETWFALRVGEFRALTRGDGAETVLFLHGLTAISEAWDPTVSHLPPGRRYVALDQRGHGRSPKPESGYGPGAYVRDALQVIAGIGRPVHVAGHSMGARIALLLAARHPEAVRSAAIIDIGPEASRANIRATVSAIAARPERFASREEAFSFAFRARKPSDEDRRLFLARLEDARDGSLTWRAPRHSLEQTVNSHRGQSYWQDWRRINLPALFIHGGASNEVSVPIAEKMRAENPRVRFERYEGIGHNIPLLAPERLAESLQAFWASLPPGGMT